MGYSNIEALWYNKISFPNDISIRNYKDCEHYIIQNSYSILDPWMLNLRYAKVSLRYPHSHKTTLKDVMISENVDLNR